LAVIAESLLAFALSEFGAWLISPAQTRTGVAFAKPATPDSIINNS